MTRAQVEGRTQEDVGIMCMVEGNVVIEEDMLHIMERGFMVMADIAQGSMATVEDMGGIMAMEDVEGIMVGQDMWGTVVGGIMVKQDIRDVAEDIVGMEDKEELTFVVPVEICVASAQ